MDPVATAPHAPAETPAQFAPTVARRAYVVWSALVFLPAFVGLTVVCSIAAWLVAHVYPDGASHLARFWSRLGCAVNFTRVTLHGRERIASDRAYVVMANHQSLVDIVALAGWLPLQLRFVMKEELRRVPFLGPACAKWGCVFVARNDRARAIASLEGAKATLQRGVSFIVFPEGTRSRDGRVAPFKKGGFMVALGLGLPILPVTILGSDRVLPPSGLWLFPGRVHVMVHPPLETTAYDVGRRDALIADVRRAILSGLNDRS